ncbi:formate dehydrogenase subunit gamma [Ferruginivarius sediminum]|uniref:Formate dehydrogenase subunit gamma n=1 Tax=Ferruginivarius sediminum TaxID=2661937 RepID=A0A369TC67_9PROT|nr:formate dehydrogenase subunit gamma [Ferruginivarius sediminum]RDD62880.1 formate dehydrogenase subunit gamma [Ferruginivarius sediminum]
MRGTIRQATSSRCGRSWLSALVLAILVALTLGLGESASGGLDALAATEGADVRPPEASGGNVPGQALGNTSDSQFWREIRRGMEGTVSIPDKKLGVLIQSEGENWRAIRNGPLSLYGSWLMLAVIALLALFFALRGRVKIDHGVSGRTVQRFGLVDRFAHWLTAVSFILLALTGLNVLYGRYVLLPVLGPEMFAALTQAGKYVHNFIAFAFMLGIVLMFVLWVKDNVPNGRDLKWLAKGGGLFGGGHPEAEKFNAGQKIIFWVVILGGISVSLSGLALLFPYSFSFFSGTFAALNMLGADLPSNLAPLQEQQLNQIWHTVVAIVMIAVILAHIYIGSIGMQGAFDAMGTGRVDENWAREHHSIWYARLTGRSGRGASGQAAE